MPSLVHHVKSTVDPKQYYTDTFPEIRWIDDSTEPRVLCPLHDDKKTPSLHVNPKTGAWYCHGCEQGGKSIVSFHAQVEGLSLKQAAIELFVRYIQPIISPTKIKAWHTALLNTPMALRYALHNRDLTIEAIKRFRLGWNGRRFVFPVINEYGLIVNARLYLAGGDPKFPKMINHTDPQEKRKFGSPPHLYPYGAMIDAKEEGYVIICEGEWDALALISMGIPTVTSTAGARSWPSQYNNEFRGLEVTLVYDNDKAGREGQSKVFRELRDIAGIVKKLVVPKRYGKDVGDWIHNKPQMQNPGGWLTRIHRASLLVENPENTEVNKELVHVRLDMASEASTFGKRIEVDAIVSGKSAAPYDLPETYRVSCNKSCDDCPLAEVDAEFREITLDPSNERILELIDIPRTTRDKILAKLAGFNAKPGCNVQVEPVKVFNVEQLILIPTIESHAAQYVMRNAYFTGHGLKSNTSYRFRGVTVPNPKDQTAVHLFDSAVPTQGEIESFKLTKKLREQLKVFSPGRRKINVHLNDIADWQSRHVTKIRYRPDLHIAVDLVFHSVAAFEFNGEEISRGMLDVLVIGDTRCGKGYVTERLCRFYKLGEVASGENCSFAGLVGGVQQVSKRWFITWGVIPLNNNRLVVIDEASALDPNDFGRMSRVRSEGVAEITKIVKEATQANTRLIWLSNPRSGRPLRSYNTGIEAVRELVGNNEDISRFDFVLSVATDEVPSEIINALCTDDLTDGEKYPISLCRALVLWAWSRKPDQVKFTNEATRTVIDSAIRFGSKYSATIPLVQGENIRVKIAKIAAAVAARTFSSDKTGEVLIVQASHVRYACSFLREAYAKQSLAYDTYSRIIKQSTTMATTDEIEKVIDQWVPTGKEKVMQALLNCRYVTPESLGDFIGDIITAKDLIGGLVQIRCLARRDDGRGYMKNPDFVMWLRNYSRRKHNAANRNKG